MKYPDTHHDTYSKTIFGFWVYLLTDFMMFGALFATYAVLKQTTPTQELFCPSYTLMQTLILLFSSFTCGLAGAFLHRKHRRATLLFFGLTFLLGAVFMGMEFTEYARLLNSGHSWRQNGFLSIFFTLVGTHALHLLLAMLWIIVLLIPVWQHGVSQESIRRLTCLRMFWQFLNIIWLFIFCIVYLIGPTHA